MTFWLAIDVLGSLCLLILIPILIYQINMTRQLNRRLHALSEVLQKDISDVRGLLGQLCAIRAHIDFAHQERSDHHTLH